MSQRNPLNERYSQDRAGSTRKSAASAKPKAKAASSVTISSGKKSPQQKKAEEKNERRLERQRQRELDRKYYNPGTPYYKRLRRIWWFCLFAAIGCTVISWLANQIEPKWISAVALIAAYGFIIAAFALDFTKIRKARREFQAEMVALEEKEARKERAAQRRQNKRNGKGNKGNRAEEKPAAIEEEKPEPEKQSFFGKLFGKKDKKKTDEASNSDENPKDESEDKPDSTKED